MGLFDFMKKKAIVLGSPAEGECVPLSQVNDPTFSGEILGKGVAIIPSKGTICAPADGEVGTVFPTGHAVALTTPEGADVFFCRCNHLTFFFHNAEFFSCDVFQSVNGILQNLI